MEKPKNCFILVDDDEITNTINVLTLQDLPFCDEVLAFTESDEVFNYLNNQKSSDLPQVVFVDYNLPFSTADEITRRLKEISSNIKTVILTVYVNNSKLNEIVAASYIDDLIFKPLTSEKVLESLKRMNMLLYDTN